MTEFYHEAGRLVRGMLEDELRQADPELWRLVDGALADAILLNSQLVVKPFTQDDILAKTHHNVLAFCEGLRRGQPVPLREERSQIEIERSKSSFTDLQDWCREVVWWGNKKGAYLYSNRLVPVESQLSGHF